MVGLLIFIQTLSAPGQSKVPCPRPPPRGEPSNRPDLKVSCGGLPWPVAPGRSFRGVVPRLGNTARAAMHDFFCLLGLVGREGGRAILCGGQRRQAVLSQVCEHASFRNSARD